MIHVKISNATPADPETPLCFSCKHLSKTRGSKGELTLRCRARVGYDSPLITCKVVECSDYYPHNEPWLNEYEQLAWVWASDDQSTPRFMRLRDLAYAPSLRPVNIGFKVVK